MAVCCFVSWSVSDSVHWTGCYPVLKSFNKLPLSWGIAEMLCMPGYRQV